MVAWLADDRDGPRMLPNYERIRKKIRRLEDDSQRPVENIGWL